MEITLLAERGIWGKMHGAPTDYRWIGRSAGMPPSDTRLEVQLLIGAEDAPAEASFWRPLPFGVCAIGTYESPARDAAGRSGFVEKQVLVWQPDPEIPCAQAMCGLLPWASSLGSAEWWEQRTDRRWANRNYTLTLRPDTRVLSPANVETALDRGLNLLSDLPEATLRAAFAGIIAGRNTVFVEGMKTPLRWEALAAFLLPFPRDEADRMSLAGAPLSRRYTKQAQELPWTVIALDGAPGKDERPESARAFGGEAEERTEQILKALAARDPGLLTPKVAVALPPDPEITRSRATATPANGKPEYEGAQQASTENDGPPTDREPRDTMVEGSVAEGAEPNPLSQIGEQAAADPESRASAPERGLKERLPEASAAKGDDNWAVTDVAPFTEPSSGLSAEALLCRQIETGEPYLSVDASARNLPLHVQNWLEFACGNEFWIHPNNPPRSGAWPPIHSGSHVGALLDAAVRRVLAAGRSREHAVKADLLRAARLVIDSSLLPQEAERLFHEVRSMQVPPLLLVAHVGAAERERLRALLGTSWQRGVEQLLADNQPRLRRLGEELSGSTR